MSEVILIILPGSMVLLRVLFVAQGPMQEMLQEKEESILPRILACPVTPAQYVLSKMLRCFLLCSGAIVLLLIVSAALFGIHWGSILMLAAVTVAWAGSMTGLVGLVFALARSREQANVLSPVVLILFAMLGGSMFPFESLPAFLQLLGQFVPNRWAVLALQGVARSRPVSELVLPFALLLAAGTLGTGAAFRLFQRRLSRGALA